MLCFSHIQPYEPFVIKNPKTSWACYGMFIDPRKTPLTLLSQFHPLLGSLYLMGLGNSGESCDSSESADSIDFGDYGDYSDFGA